MTPRAVRFEVAARGGTDRLSVERRPGGFWIRSDASDDEGAAVGLERLEGSEWWRLTTNGVSIPVRLRQSGGTVHVIVGAERVAVGVRRALPVPTHRSRAAVASGAVEVRAPMPGLVVATPVHPGQAVGRGRAVAIVEAMKMQMEVAAPVAGRIDEVRVRAGQEVAGEQVLVVIRVSPEGTP